MVEVILASVMTAIAKEVTVEIAGRIRNKKPSEINLEVFQRNVETAIKQALHQFHNRVDARFCDNENKISYLRKAIDALSITVADINQYVGYDTHSCKNKLFLAAPEQTITENEIEELSTQNTRQVFSSIPNNQEKQGIADFAIIAKDRADEWLDDVRGETNDV
ncbi:MAG: hypothetical protein FWH14_00505 [Oscillospiraceae bacterium]|nr:hypothetical protein [Oscillospiraceae bacterium]